MGEFGQNSYNTNLASEFFVMSVLHRLGLDAHLTLGNKKAVDVVIVRTPGDSVTVDVKAVAGKVDWLVGNTPIEPRNRHFIALITYNGRFADPSVGPCTWVLPHQEFLNLIKSAKPPSKMRFVSRVDVVKLTERAEAWNLLCADLHRGDSETLETQR
jgi:hypothetical protein